ncbi:MAG TPA: hypothetical protein VJV87_03810, partial [Sphingomicrobium sp.]|nr:hypothetical protein [Sphingomicrobium sp.]
KLLGATEFSAKQDGSDFARQLVRRLRYCVLSSLGRKDEASSLLPEMMAHAVDAPGPTMEGLLCAGQIDKAEQLVLQTLDDPKATSIKKLGFERNIVRALQPVPLTGDSGSVWANNLTQLQGRPAIVAAYHRLGRDMPVEYLTVRAN